MARTSTLTTRLGGVLVLALGAVLLTTGLDGRGLTVGANPLPASCGAELMLGGGTVTPCPTSTITFTQTTTTAAAAARAAHAAPASWSVTIDSDNCPNRPNGSLPVTVTVPNGGSAASPDLYEYTDSTRSTACTYSYTQQAVSGYTATFDPASPQSIVVARGTFDVTLTDTAAAATTTSSAPATTTTATATPTAAPSTTTRTAVVAPTSAAPTPTAPTLPFTGSSPRTHASLVAGSALCVLGLLMLVGAGHLGRLRPSRRH